MNVFANQIRTPPILNLVLVFLDEQIDAFFLELPMPILLEQINLSTTFFDSIQCFFFFLNVKINCEKIKSLTSFYNKLANESGKPTERTDEIISILYLSWHHVLQVHVKHNSSSNISDEMVIK